MEKVFSNMDEGTSICIHYPLLPAPIPEGRSSDGVAGRCILIDVIEMIHPDPLCSETMVGQGSILIYS